MQFLQYGRFLFPFGGFASILRERLRQRIGIPCFEEDHIFRLVLRPDFFDGVVNTVFPRDPLKIFDVRIVAFDGGDTLILSDELSDRLFSVRDYRFFALFVLPVVKIFRNYRPEQPSGQLCRTDGQRNGSAFDFFLDEASPPAGNFVGLMPPTRLQK